MCKVSDLNSDVKGFLSDLVLNTISGRYCLIAGIFFVYKQAYCVGINSRNWQCGYKPRQGRGQNRNGFLTTRVCGIYLKWSIVEQHPKLYCCAETANNAYLKVFRFCSHIDFPCLKCGIMPLASCFYSLDDGVFSLTIIPENTLFKIHLGSHLSRIRLGLKVNAIINAN